MPAAFIVALLLLLTGCSPRASRQPEVIVYVSEDRVFSEPILKDFEKAAGVAVRAVYDTEEAKSTGVMNRLLAEKANPQADVYWANEPVRADVLRQQGISMPFEPANAKGIDAKFIDPSHHWTGFSARARVFVVNKSARFKPEGLDSYAKPEARGRGVIANPLFGTTTAQMAALFAHWGDAQGQAFLDSLKANRVKMSTGNGESADLVASGEFDFSLVDSDDAVDRIRHGKPIDIVYPDQSGSRPGLLLIPNAVSLIRGGPNPENARKLIEYLVSKETERKLALADCAQIPLHPDVTPPAELKPIGELRVMPVDYAALGAKLQEIQPRLKKWAGY
jgi:iron(III) transport system substrate-binding protein